MPYRASGKCVHKLNADGSLGETVPGGCHDSEGEAQDHAAALNAAVEDEKAAPRLMIVVASNAYKDREDEIIRERALKAYVESCWKEGQFVGDNPLLLWHGGEPIGRIKFAEMVGPFLLEVHEELPDAPINIAQDGDPELMTTIREVWDGLETRDDLGASHEFGYVGPDREDGVYEMIVKSETSILPRDDAANGYTLAEVMRR